MRIHLLPEAADEILQAVTWYYDQERTLAADFYREFKRAEAEINTFPEFWRSLGGGYRRKLLDRYPYGVIYRVEHEDLIIVVALAHTSRRPDYWRQRL